MSALTDQHKSQMRRRFLWTVSTVGAAVAFAAPTDASGVSTKIPIGFRLQTSHLSCEPPDNKAALIDVGGAEWCEFSHVLDDEIFVDPRVAPFFPS